MDVTKIVLLCYNGREALRRIHTHKHGWMDDSRLYVLFNSMSVISGRWADDNERLLFN